MNTAEIIQLIQDDAYLRSKLYCRGYLVTNRPVQTDAYPFYGAWSLNRLGPYQILTHPLCGCFLEKRGNDGLCLLGHAYHPASGETSEQKILNKLCDFAPGSPAFYDYVNELTGVFLLLAYSSRELSFLCDAVGLMSVFYTESAEAFYISSHVNLIGDLTGFREDPIVTRLKKGRTFHYFGNQLPGNLTKFREVKRLNPNHYGRVDSTVEQIRFYYPHTLPLSQAEIVRRLRLLLEQTMAVIAEKWERPAISLTGGCDSKTTLAAAHKLYDRFRYFSYDSQPNETPDAKSAAAICSRIGVPHLLYNIPYSDESFANIENIRRIMIWNDGDIVDNRPNDVRKRAYLDQRSDYDVEVKSWASEVGRARYSKRYCGKRSFGKSPSARKCATFYKFLLNRGDVQIARREFRNYLNKYFQAAEERPIPWQDQFYWEWHWPSRDGVILTCEHMFSDCITVPYNNRRILELLLSVPWEDRYRDTVYTAIRAELDPRIDEAAESIVDVNHTKLRSRLEMLYYLVSTGLPY